MTQQFTAIEVRAEAHRHANEVEDMLTAYADLLDARERAVPVYQHRRKNGSMLRWFDCSEETFMAMEHNEHDRKHFDRRILYTHPASADAERLAEALQEILDYRGGAANALEDEYVVDRAHHALAAHSAQAQPPAASVTIDAVMRVIDGQRRLPYCSIDEKQAFRNELEAALAAQENPNG